MKPKPPIIAFKTVASWEAYLAEHYTDEAGIMMKLAKKGTRATTITHEEALEVALTYGWIDGIANKLDETYWMIKFTPRRRRSIWSKRNCEKVLRLIREGKMKPSGLAEVEAAKKDGRWEAAYDSPSTMTVPQDFLDELQQDARAYDFFRTLNKTNTYAIAWRLQTAKKPETRERRKRELLAMLAAGRKLY